MCWCFINSVIAGELPLSVNVSLCINAEKLTAMKSPFSWSRRNNLSLAHWLGTWRPVTLTFYTMGIPIITPGILLAEMLPVGILSSGILAVGLGRTINDFENVISRNVQPVRGNHGGRTSSYVKTSSLSNEIQEK